jgi:hypothetical protein
VRCRQITEADIATVVALLARGFQERTREFWLDLFTQLSAMEPPPSFPKYGYLLESRGLVVGVILLIFSRVRAGGATSIRCNLSSWYVEPKFRAYAGFLVSQALRYKDVTYLNISPVPNTEPLIEAQGFLRYCDGVFIALPILNGLLGGGVEVFGADREPKVDFDLFEQKLLQQHAARGCISLWCATSQHAYPFVFRPRMIKVLIPCAQLIYCRDIGDFVRFAGPIGRFLALRGKPLVMVDAHGPVAGLIGVFSRDKLPKYFKGPQCPRLGDLAFTELALFGI